MNPNELEKSLELRPVDNIALNGDLIETYRGDAELRKYLTPCPYCGPRHLFHDSHKFGGNHYHKFKFEIMAVFDSDIRVFLKDPQTGEYYSRLIAPNHKFNLVPAIAHALFKDTPGRAEILEYTNLVFNPAEPKKDVYEFQVIDKNSGRII